MVYAWQTPACTKSSRGCFFLSLFAPFCLNDEFYYAPCVRPPPEILSSYLNLTTRYDNLRLRHAISTACFRALWSFHDAFVKMQRDVLWEGETRFEENEIFCWIFERLYFTFCFLNVIVFFGKGDPIPRNRWRVFFVEDNFGLCWIFESLYSIFCLLHGALFEKRDPISKNR